MIPVIAMKFQDTAVKLPELLVVVFELDEAEVTVEAGLDDEAVATVVLDDGVAEVREVDEEEVEATATLELVIVVEMGVVVARIEDITLTVLSEKFVTKISPLALS